MPIREDDEQLMSKSGVDCTERISEASTSPPCAGSAAGKASGCSLPSSSRGGGDASDGEDSRAAPALEATKPELDPVSERATASDAPPSPSTPSSPPADSFQVQLIRCRGQKLGVDIDDTDGVALKIMRLKPGLVYEWNCKHEQHVWITTGCRIVEVNGISNNVDLMFTECMKEAPLNITVQRPRPPEGEQPRACPTENAEVYVHVYDLTRSRAVGRLNSLTTRFGLFHTGVEVYGREWYFCGVDSSFDGVYAMPQPKIHPKHRYRRTIRMGRTPLSRDDLEEFLPLIRMRWPGWSYHVFRRNCHHFVDHFCRVLGFAAGPRLGLCGSGDLTLAVDRRPAFPWCSCFGTAKKPGEPEGVPLDTPLCSPAHCEAIVDPDPSSEEVPSMTPPAGVTGREHCKPRAQRKSQDSFNSLCGVMS